MVRYWAELAGDSVELALLELSSVVDVFSPGSPPVGLAGAGVRLAEFSSPDPVGVAERLTFSHRVLTPVCVGNIDELSRAMGAEGESGATAAIRNGRSETVPEELTFALGKEYVRGGGRIDLSRPESKYVLFGNEKGSGRYAIAREIAPARRAILRQVKSVTLPFRKPVSLSPLLACTLVNLSRVSPGGLILDPLCGTGVIPIEAGLLGYRVAVADADGRMLKGTLRNLEHHGVNPVSATQCKLSGLQRSMENRELVDAVVTDPPYGRASTTLGSKPVDVLKEALAVLPKLTKRGGRFVGMVPSPSSLEGLLSPWVIESGPVPLRMHRSLTRWVFVLRAGYPS